MLILKRAIPLLAVFLHLCPAFAGAQAMNPEHRSGHTHADPASFIAHRLRQTAPDGKSARTVLDLVKKSISENNPRTLQPLFNSKVYLSLLTGKEGYFSAEQTFFILKDFFLTYTPLSFSYSNTATETDNPYGVGTLQYVKRGNRGEAQLFVSLTRSGDIWRVSQITITDR